MVFGLFPLNMMKYSLYNILVRAEIFLNYVLNVQRTSAKEDMDLLK